MRSRTQLYLFHTGRVVQNHAGKIMFAGILLLAMLCIGLKNIELQTDMEDLWVEGEYSGEVSMCVCVCVGGGGGLHRAPCHAWRQ